LLDIFTYFLGNKPLKTLIYAIMSFASRFTAFVYKLGERLVFWSC